MAAEINRSDLFSDDALMAPLILAKNLREPVAVLDELIKKALEHNKVIANAESTTALKKETEELTAEQKELIKVQNQIATITARNNDAYREQQLKLTLLKKELKEKTVLGQKDAVAVNKLNSSLTELRAALDKNRAAFANLRNEEERASKEGQELLATIQQQDQDVKELSATIGKHTDNVGNYEGAMKNLKVELKAARDEMIGIAATMGTDSAEFVAAAEKAGQLKDEIADLNDATNAVSGSPFENFSTSLGTVGSKLRAMDFKGAADSAKQFAKVSKTITFKESITGAGNFGKTMVTMGKALLTNPFVLLAAVVIAIAIAVYELREKIKPLTIAFDFVGAAMDYVIQLGKDFLDWLGLSTFALDEKAQRTVDAAKKEIEAITERYDDEIAIAESAGKKTTQLERDKWNAIIAEASKAYTELVEKKNRNNNKLNEEDQKALEENIKVIKDANKELIILENKLQLEKSKLREEARLKEQGDLFKLRQFRLQIQIEEQEEILTNLKKSEGERLEAASKAADLRRQLAFLEYNNAMKADNLTYAGRVLIHEQLQEKLSDITAKGVEERTKINKEEDDEAEEARKKRIDEAYKEADQVVKAKENEVKGVIEAIQQQVIDGKKTKEQGDKEIEKAEKDLADDIVQTNIDALNKILINEQLNAEERKELEQKLIDFRGKLTNALYDQIAKKERTVLEKTQEDLQELAEVYAMFADSVGEALNNITEGRLADLDREQEANDQKMDADSKALTRKMEMELVAAGDNAEAKAAIEEAYAVQQSEMENSFARKQAEIEKKKIEAQRRQAVFDKATSAVQAAIATALAVTKALPNIPLAVATGIFGALQVATILSKPIPAFEKGGVHSGGLLIAGEKGMERVEVPGLEPFFTPDVPTLMNMPARTKIINHEDTMKDLAASQLQYSFDYESRREEQQSKEILRELRMINYSVKNKVEAHWSLSKGDIKKAFKNSQTMNYFLENYYK